MTSVVAGAGGLVGFCTTCYEGLMSTLWGAMCTLNPKPLNRLGACRDLGTGVGLGFFLEGWNGEG